MNKTTTHGFWQTYGEWIFFLLLVLFKLWLVHAQKLIAVSGSIHDDQLFITLADSLAHLDWLGDFNNRTLIKGPVYPLFIASTYRLGLPLLLSQHLLYISACLIFSIAVKPLIKHRLLRVILTAFLLFNPATYETLRVVRLGIYSSLSLLTLGCAIGLMIRYNQSLKKIIIWSIGLGCSFSAFWLTRGEGLWLVPSLMLFGLYFVIIMMIHNPTCMWKRMATGLGIPISIWLAGILVVCSLNYLCYGVFITTEFKANSFKAAYGSLLRVKHDTFAQYLTVPKETRHRMYTLSPSFNELNGYLDGWGGKRWASFGAALSGYPADSGEIPGILFFWAFRDAVADAGYYQHAPTAMAYYDRLADEINTACDSGQVACFSEKATLVPRWRPEFRSLMIDSFGMGILRMCSFFEVPSPQFSTGASSGWEAFKRIARSPIAIAPGQPGYSATTDYSPLDQRKIRYLQFIPTIYRYTIPLFSAIGILLLIIAPFRQRGFSALWIINASLIGAVLTRLYILSYFYMTSFDAFKPRHMGAIYSAFIPFGCLSLCFLYDLVIKRIKT